MRVLSVKLENEMYESFALSAAGAGKQPDVLAAEILAAWTTDRLKAGGVPSAEARARYVETRLRGDDAEVAARTLAVSSDVIAGWDREIRTDPAAWSVAFIAASRGVDPLTWEMTTRERFYGLWGHRPKAGG